MKIIYGTKNLKVYINGKEIPLDSAELHLNGIEEEVDEDLPRPEGSA